MLFHSLLHALIFMGNSWRRVPCTTPGCPQPGTRLQTPAFLGFLSGKEVDMCISQDTGSFQSIRCPEKGMELKWWTGEEPPWSDVPGVHKTWSHGLDFWGWRGLLALRFKLILSWGGLVWVVHLSLECWYFHHQNHCIVSMYNFSTSWVYVWCVDLFFLNQPTSPLTHNELSDRSFWKVSASDLV